MNPLAVLALAAALVAFSLTYRGVRGKAKTSRLIGFLAATLLSFPACLMTLHYLHVLPEWSWFYTFRSWTGSEFCVIPLGVAAALAATWLPRFLLMIPLTGCVGASLVPHLKPLLGPLDERTFSNDWDGMACQQSTPSTCGPASLATILRDHGVAVTEREIARAAYSYQGGTEAWYLARYARARGMKTDFVFRETFDPLAGSPAVVGVNMGLYGHFIAVLEAENGVVRFADPLRSMETLPLEEFRRRYQFTGFHLVVSK